MKDVCNSFGSKLLRKSTRIYLDNKLEIPTILEINRLDYSVNISNIK